MFLQPGSSGADYFQYDSTNAVNWQIKGKPGSHLNLNTSPVSLTVSHYQNPYGACYLDVKCNEIKAATQSAVKGSSSSGRFCPVAFISNFFNNV